MQITPNNISSLYCILLLVLCLLLPTASADQIRVAVAANFLATLNAVKPAYENLTGDRLIISSGSTGSLYAQIINGAPYDVLLAADRSYTEKLTLTGKAIEHSRFIYAQGQLVLWGRDPKKPITKTSIFQLGEQRLAIANPRIAPYGRAALEVLQQFDVTVNLVRGGSINQAFQFAATGNVSLGLVALSQVLNPNNVYNRKNYWQVPASYYQALDQEAVLLQYGANNEKAKQFLEYLKSPSARQIILRYGYQ